MSQSASDIREALEPQDEEKDGSGDERREDAEDDEDGAGGFAGTLHDGHRDRTTVASTLEVLGPSLHRHTLHGHTLHRSARSVLTVLGPGCALIAGNTVGGIRHVRAFLKEILLKHNNAEHGLDSAPTQLEHSDTPRSYAVSSRGGKRQREPQRGRGPG